MITAFTEARKIIRDIIGLLDINSIFSKRGFVNSKMKTDYAK